MGSPGDFVVRKIENRVGLTAEEGPRVAVVTGAGRGIGRAVAIKLASAGCSVAVADIREPGAVETAETIWRLSGSAKVFAVDVSDQAAVEDLFERVEASLGTVNVLANVAGVLSTALVVDLRDEEWDRVLAVNLKGTFLCSRAAVRRMLEREGSYGRIVNVSSEVARTPQPGLAHYAASKAGVIALTQALALEVAKSGVTVNCVVPTLTDTEMISEHAEDLAQVHGGTSDEWRKAFHQLIPMGRMATPEEVSAVISFLVSDDARFVTGACYNVTGGREFH